MAKPSILNPNPERLNVMKKIYFVLAVLVAATLVSCEKEQSFEQLTPLREGDVAFMLQNASTRSAGDGATIHGVSIPVGKTNDGNSFFLEETIERLNPNPGTKGAPAYTVNVGNLYSTMGVYADAGTGNFQGGATFELMDSEMYDRKDASEGKGWRYFHYYPGEDPWPSDPDADVDFYLNMPASPAGVTITTRASGETVFTYDASTLTTAEDQQDILFSQTSISKNDHQGFSPNGAPVLMYHALTGVKFRTGWANDTGTKTIIKSVKWTGLKSSGTCTVNTSATNVVTWTVDDTSTAEFTQTFSNPTYSAESGVDGSVQYVSDAEHPENNKFGDSWYAAANDKNLNNANGEWTFWFMPQEVADNVILEVTFLIKTADTPNGKEEITHVIDFGAQLNRLPDPEHPGQYIHRENNVKWEAGQLRTYTLKPIHVDVDVFDNMDAAKVVKSNLHITNTGNVDQYVRVYIIGNWFGKRQIKAGEYNDYESILMGYTDNEKNALGEYVNYIEVARWNDKDFVWSGAVGTSTKQYDKWQSPTTEYDYTPYGNFVGLPEKGTSTGPGRSNGKGWVRHDKFYYYTEIIGPGGRVPETSPLFETYTIGQSPDFWIADMTGERRLAKDVHFVMDIAVQAVAVPYNGDTAVGYEDAWKAALGVDDINDL